MVYKYFYCRICWTRQRVSFVPMAQSKLQWISLLNPQRWTIWLDWWDCKMEDGFGRWLTMKAIWRDSSHWDYLIFFGWALTILLYLHTKLFINYYPFIIYSQLLSCLNCPAFCGNNFHPNTSPQNQHILFVIIKPLLIHFNLKWIGLQQIRFILNQFTNDENNKFFINFTHIG